MSALWELFQEYQLHKRTQQTGSVEERVVALENELQFVEQLLEQLIPIVEDISGEAIEPVNS
jgi:hypothetical protein